MLAPGPGLPFLTSNVWLPAVSTYELPLAGFTESQPLAMLFLPCRQGDGLPSTGELNQPGMELRKTTTIL